MVTIRGSRWHLGLCGLVCDIVIHAHPVIQIQQHDQAVVVQVMWEQADFVVHLSDLQDACPIDDLEEITWPRLSPNDTTPENLA